jgi:hypothetical protein
VHVQPRAPGNDHIHYRHLLDDPALP